jgi:hypothetical protein
MVDFNFNFVFLFQHRLIIVCITTVISKAFFYLFKTNYKSIFNYIFFVIYTSDIYI